MITRRHFTKLLGATGLLATTGGLATATAQAAGAAKDAAKLRKNVDARPKTLINATPAVYAPTTDSATIIISLNAPARGWVEYGTDPARLNLRSGGDAFGFLPHDERVLKIRLRGLAPGTRYYWRAACVALLPPAATATGAVNRNALPPDPPPVHTPVYNFATLDPAAPETTFAVWSDTHWHEDVLLRLADLTFGQNAVFGHGSAGVPPAGATQSRPIQNPNERQRQLDKSKIENPPAFLLLNGDHAPNHNDPSLIADTYIHPAGRVDLAKGPPVFLCRGNHDVRGRWAGKVSDYIDFPDTHENRVQRPFYAFRSGPLAALVLDSGEDKPDSDPSFRNTVALEPLLAEQARWIEQVTQRPGIKDAPVKVVFCHMPLFHTPQRAKSILADPNGYGQFRINARAPWRAPLVKWGARVVISGHIHRWSHTPAGDGVPIAQITVGGAPMQHACLLRGHCTAKELRLTAHNMDGKVVASVIV